MAIELLLMMQMQKEEKQRKKAREEQEKKDQERRKTSIGMPSYISANCTPTFFAANSTIKLNMPISANCVGNVNIADVSISKTNFENGGGI
jgi:hypothetical protein